MNNPSSPLLFVIFAHPALQRGGPLLVGEVIVWELFILDNNE
jgi:hypothetical protein